jgi:hypothetical protein
VLLPCFANRGSAARFIAKYILYHFGPIWHNRQLLQLCDILYPPCGVPQEHQNNHNVVTVLPHRLGLIQVWATLPSGQGQSSADLPSERLLVLTFIQTVANKG